MNDLNTELIIIGTSKRLNQLDQNPRSTPYAINIERQNTRGVKLVSYLGMKVDDKLTWDYHIEHISSRISHNIGILKRIRPFILQDPLLLLYHTLIALYSRYCNIIWGNVVRS